MGVAGLRDAFNAVASPRYTASMAFLSTEHSAGREWSRLLFRGIRGDGAAFEVASDLLPGGADVNQAARQVAQKLISSTPDSIGV